MVERWPPVYDAEELAMQIRELAGSDYLESKFYVNNPDCILCQGDIFGLAGPIPVIDEDGEAVAIDDVEYWMAIGNTCDFARSLDTVKWTQMVPVLDLGDASELSSDDLRKLRSFQPYRSFYVPYWKPEMQGRVLCADFTRPVAVHKQAVQNVAKLEARLSQKAWLLFHSCLIRFLARDDGRYD